MVYRTRETVKSVNTINYRENTVNLSEAVKKGEWDDRQ